MYSRVEMITPEMAKQYLEKNMVHNRDLARTTVHKYADDMRAGRWELTSQGITFNERGDLVDGQHRLAAIIEACVPVQMNVTYDEKNDVSIHDRGRGRTLNNVMAMQGVPKTLANNTTIGAARLLLRFAGCSTPSDLRVCDFMQANQELFQIAYGVCCKGGNGTHAFSKKSSIVAAVFCALIDGVPVDDIEGFCKVLNTGYQEEKSDSAAIVLRNYFSNVLAEKYPTAGSASTKPRVFSIVTNALHDYCNRVPRTTLWPIKQPPRYLDVVKEKILKHYAV